VSEVLAVGLMSGTSLDGVSTALVRLGADPLAPSATLVAFRQERYSAAERGAIIDAMARATPKDLALLHVALGERFAGAVLALLLIAKGQVMLAGLLFVAAKVVATALIARLFLLTPRRCGTSRAGPRCSWATPR